jgi:hypothetical protein
MALAAALCACSTYGSGKVILGADPMAENVRQWTRSAKLYRQFDTTALVDVTYNSLKLRGQAVENLARIKRMSAEEKDRMMLQQERESREYAQFYLAMYTSELEWSNLAKKDPAWIVFIETDKGPVFAEPAVKIRRDQLPWNEGNLPYDPRFRAFYKINIPRHAALEGPIRLMLSSLLGEVQITWDQQ